MKITITLAALFGSLFVSSPQLLAQVDPFGEPAQPPAVVEEEVVEEEVIEEEPSYETENVVIEPRISMFMPLQRNSPVPLQSKVDSTGFIDNRHEWASLWVSCNDTEPLPKVDFTRELVVYYFYIHSTVKIPAVAYVTDGTLSLQPMLFRVGLPRVGDFYWVHAQIIPREGLVQFSKGSRSILIPGNFLAKPANPTTP